MSKPLSSSYITSRPRSLNNQPHFSEWDRSKGFLLIGITALVAILISAALFYISTHVEQVDLGYKINRALEQKQKLIEENKHLSLEIAQLSSPAHLEQQAENQFALQIPQPNQLLYYSRLDGALPQTAKPVAQIAKMDLKHQTQARAKPHSDLRTKTSNQMKVAKNESASHWSVDLMP